MPPALIKNLMRVTGSTDHAKLSRAIGVSNNVVCRWSNGKRKVISVTVKTMMGISARTGISVQVLAGWCAGEKVPYDFGDLPEIGGPVNPFSQLFVTRK